MQKVKYKEVCDKCGHTTYHYEYFCDECSQKLDNDNIIRIEYTASSESDKNALIENEGEFCSLECALVDMGNWESLIDMTIRGINHDNFKRKGDE